MNYLTNVVMGSYETKIKIRYGETDHLGYAHPCYFTQYFVETRIGLLKKFGIDIKELADSGIILPVKSMKVKFISPIFFNDELEIKCNIHVISDTRLAFNYEVFNQDNILTCKARQILAILDKTTYRSIRIQKVKLMHSFLAETRH